MIIRIPILMGILSLIKPISAQDPIPHARSDEAQMGKEVFETLVTLSSKEFYINSENDYTFQLERNDQKLVFELVGGEPPRFIIEDSVIAASGISEKGHSVSFLFPPELGSEVLKLLPAVANFEMIEMKKMKEMKPSININGSDTMCTEGIFPEDSGALTGQNFDLCFFSQYEKDTLQLFDSKEMLTYKNRTVLAIGSDEYVLDHWFEPKNFGFVKFRLTFPDGEEWKIDLISVEN